MIRYKPFPPVLPVIYQGNEIAEAVLGDGFYSFVLPQYLYNGIEQNLLSTQFRYRSVEYDRELNMTTLWERSAIEVVEVSAASK